MPRRRSRSRRRFRKLFHLRNTLDFAALEPGDLILVANPTDPVWMQLSTFWSHAAMYVGGDDDARAFVDAVNLPVRRAARRTDGGLLWQRVRFTSLRGFQSYMDLVALRPPLPAEARHAAAAYARSQVGKPFFGDLVASMVLPRGRDRSATPGEFTCSSLIWHAYKAQGFDLSRGILGGFAPWPSRLDHDRRLQHVARGTRVKPLRPARGQLGLYLVRAWFRYGLRSDIIWRGVAGG